MITMTRPRKKPSKKPRTKDSPTRTNKIVTVKNAVPMSDLARKLPGKIQPATLTRYCRQGVRSRLTGKVVTLEFVCLPNGFGSNEEAYYRFLEELNGS